MTIMSLLVAVAVDASALVADVAVIAIASVDVAVVVVVVVVVAVVVVIVVVVVVVAACCCSYYDLRQSEAMANGQLL